METATESYFIGVYAGSSWDVTDQRSHADRAIEKLKSPIPNVRVEYENGIPTV